MNQTFNGDVEAEISARATKMRANNTLKYNKIRIKIPHTKCQRVSTLAGHKLKQSPNEWPEPGLRLRSPCSMSGGLSRDSALRGALGSPFLSDSPPSPLLPPRPGRRSGAAAEILFPSVGPD